MAVTWLDQSTGSAIVKTYSAPIKGAVLLRGGSGVAMVEPDGAAEASVVIFNADGTERFRAVAPPIDGVSVIGFDQLYYVGQELTAIISGVGRDFAYVIDPANGRYVRSYETR